MWQHLREQALEPKTEADHAEMARLEWYGSLYLQDSKPRIPGEMKEAAI